MACEGDSENFGRKPMKRSSGARIFLVFVVIALLSGVARIVTSFLQDEANHDSQGLRQDVLLSSITGAFVLAVIGGIALSLIPGQRRLKILRAENPDDVVLTGRWNPAFSEYVLANYLPGLRRPNQIRGIAFAAVSDRVGIQIWSGVGTPREVAALRWVEVDSVSLGWKSISPIRTVSTIDLQLPGDSGPLQFAVASQGWAGAFPRGEEANRPLVDQLAQLRRDSTNSPV
jgi:hypothetical protein